MALVEKVSRARFDGMTWNWTKDILPRQKRPGPVQNPKKVIKIISHNGRPLFIFITGLDYKKRKFWSSILKAFWDFLILCSDPCLARSTESKWFKDHLQIKKSQNDFRIALQNFVFFKVLARNENGRCLVKDSSIVSRKKSKSSRKKCSGKKSSWKKS
jgi:hypothetical protein